MARVTFGGVTFDAKVHFSPLTSNDPVYEAKPLLTKAKVITLDLGPVSPALWNLLSGGLPYPELPRRVNIPRARRYPRVPIRRPVNV